MYIGVTYFVLVLPLVVAIYLAAPKRFRWIVLLAASYALVLYSSVRLAVFPLLATLASWLCGLALDRLKAEQKVALKEPGAKRREVKAAFRKRMRLVLTLGVVFDLGLLFCCKYLRFSLNLMGLAPAEGQTSLLWRLSSVGMPAGISFYTLMAVSYIADVYRGTIKAERNPARLALYVSFFPQMLEGPIARHGQVAGELASGEGGTRDDLYRGSLRILWGLAKKIIVADRLNGFVELVFDGYATLDGGIIAIGAIAYTFQLYCDFSGAIDVALGSAQLFGVRLPENFRQPFLSRTASEFWERWHVTLGAFFRDYVYYPVSLCGPMKRLTSAARKRFGLRYGPLIAGSVALLAVWVCNGIWHGAGSQYLCFGLYYFAIITAGGLIEPVAQNLSERFGFSRDAIAYQAVQRVRTLLVIFVGETIFRAAGLRNGLAMLKAVVTRFSFEAISQGALVQMKLDGFDWCIVIVALLGLLVFDIQKERGRDVASELADAKPVVRWGVWIALALLLLVFGAFGVGYDPVEPLYANF